MALSQNNGVSDMAEATSTALAKKPTKKAAAKKSTAKKPATKKAVAKKEQDVIEVTAHQLENLSKADAFKMVHELAENVDYTYFKLGGVLSVIQDNNWFQDEGYETIKAFVEQEFGIKYRKAMYLIAIYNGLVDSGVAWEKVKDIGWTKLKELAGILTEENVDHWVKAAKSMTLIQLVEAIKQSKKDGNGKADEPSTTTPDVSSMTFKLHKDQREMVDAALEKAKEEADTDASNVALESICTAYLNSGTKKGKAKQKTMKEQMEAAGWEEVLGQFEKIWPDIDLSVTV